MNKSYFIWPDCDKFSILSQINNGFHNSKKIINWFEQRFPGSHPVLVSSGRSAITSCLITLNAGRNNYVSIAPFSSACIFRSVGGVATPVPGNIVISPEFELLYHQWGFEHKSDFTCKRINDSVDTLFQDNQSLFSNNADFEIISLSKILGSPFGGIIFCSSEELRNKLLNTIDNQLTMKWVQFGLRMLSKTSKVASTLWNYGESTNTAIPDIGLGDILRRLDKWDLLIKERKEKLSIVNEIIPSWVKISPGRFPCAIPVELKWDCLTELGELGFTSELRHFNTSLNQSQWSLKRVFPLPVHQQIPTIAIERAIKLLKSAQD